MKLRLADRVFETLNGSHEEIIKTEKITHIFHGTDWKQDDYTKWIGEDMIKKYNLELIFVPYTKGIDSSNIRKAMKSI